MITRLSLLNSLKVSKMLANCIIQINHWTGYVARMQVRLVWAQRCFCKCWARESEDMRIIIIVCLTNPVILNMV